MDHDEKENEDDNQELSAECDGHSISNNNHDRN